MEIKQDYDLTKLNTLGISARALYFVELNKEVDLAELFSSEIFKNNQKFFLGGGSNILFTQDFDGIVILNKLKGIEIIAPTEVGVPTGVGKDDVYIRAMGGEAWQNLVDFSVERGLWGIENLSLIPGTVGGAPMQNIGAYGAELKDVLETVEAYAVDGGTKKIFTKEECELGYRDSIFKNSLKGKYFITGITLKLSKIENKNIKYKVLQEYLNNNNIQIKNSKDVSDAVSAIRRSKLPDPALLHNAGSFFKNVVLGKKIMSEKIQNLKMSYPDMPFFEEEDTVKIPAAWLIEQCGWKGKKLGNVGVHDRQALVLVNFGGATGAEVKKLALDIIASVSLKFGLNLVIEVNLI